jgi:hypothetical protein
MNHQRSTKILCIYFSELIIAKLYWYTKIWAYVLLLQSQVKKSKAFVVRRFVTCFNLDTKICIQIGLKGRNFKCRGSHLNTKFQFNVKRTKKKSSYSHPKSKHVKSQVGDVNITHIMIFQTCPPKPYWMFPSSKPSNPYWQNLEMTLCHYCRKGHHQLPKPPNINISIFDQHIHLVIKLITLHFQARVQLGGSHYL